MNRGILKIVLVLLTLCLFTSNVLGQLEPLENPNEETCETLNRAIITRITALEETMGSMATTQQVVNGANAVADYMTGLVTNLAITMIVAMMCLIGFAIALFLYLKSKRRL